MPIMIDHQLRELIPHDNVEFPITYFHDELITLPNFSGPLHWHPNFEIATAKYGVLDYQVGDQHVTLEAGDSIFVNVNVLHGIKQVSGEVADSMPNIVFSASIIAPETSAIYKKYILPIAQCDFLPYVVFRDGDRSCEKINCCIKDIYTHMAEKSTCYEFAVQRSISKIFEYISSHFNELFKNETARIQINNQIRLQKMLSFIYENHSSPITLEDIARSANISKSEAGRCFHTYMHCSPIEALIQYRLQMAHRYLSEGTQTLQQISSACGFNSVNYFSRQFKKRYGYTPGQHSNTGK